MQPIDRRSFLAQTALGAAAAAALPGRLSAQPADATTEALRVGWPGVAGPSGTYSTPAIRLVDDLSRATQIWESECRDLGRAKGTSQAFRRVEQFTEAALEQHRSHPGSWSGPVVAGGLVFAASWRPVGPWVACQGHRVRLDAEDFVVAIDALTGRTRWLTAEPGGIFRGGGKRQGFQVAPVVHRGVVYSVGSTGRIFAHNAESGRKVWESNAHPAREAQRAARERALAGLAEGRFSYDLSPDWCASLAVAQDVLIVPDQNGGLVGVDLAAGERRWTAPNVLSKWSTPTVWRHDGRDYLVCANVRGEMRLLDPTNGRELWRLTGLGPNWLTLTPGRDHVLVNTVADSGSQGEVRRPGRLGAVRLSPERGEKSWLVGDGRNHNMPVWMDSGARIRVLHQNGKFLVPMCWQGHANRPDEGNFALLVDEATGRTLAHAEPVERWNDQLSGVVYWCGDRIVCRADSFHGPTHGGRHPWMQWSTADNRLTPLTGRMDLSSFTNGYEVPMEAPLVGGLMFERTMTGSIVCYDLRAARE